MEQLCLEPWVRGPLLCPVAKVALVSCSLSLHHQQFMVDEREGGGGEHDMYMCRYMWVQVCM